MRGAVIHGAGEVRLEQLAEPTIIEATDAVAVIPPIPSQSQRLSDMATAACLGYRQCSYIRQT